MKTYQEMAEAVFREGDRRIAVRSRKRKALLTGGAVGAAALLSLAVFGLLRQKPVAMPPTLPPTGETAAAVMGATGETTTAVTGTTRETTARTDEAVTNPGLTPPGTGENDPAATESRQPTDWRPPETGDPAGTETPTGGGQNAAATETTTAAPVATAPAEETPSGPSGAASYNSENWTEADVGRSGWARFFRWPGYEDKFWLYYDGRTYRCDPFAGRPLAYGDYLCALSDCAHDFADEDGAGVYVLLENGEPLPVTAAVAVVFPDGGSYAMIRPAE